jgi:hypothetical protein
LNDLAKDLFCAIFCHVYIYYRKKICFFCFFQSYFFKMQTTWESCLMQ